MKGYTTGAGHISTNMRFEVHKTNVDGLQDNPYVMTFSDSTGWYHTIYVDSDVLLDVVAKTTLFAAENGLLCRCGDPDCVKKTTDCCACERWECETTYAGSPDDPMIVCADQQGCALWDNDDIPALRDLADGAL